MGEGSRSTTIALILALAPWLLVPAALLVAGLTAAFLVIPEWRVNDLGEASRYEAIFGQQAQRLGYRLLPEQPRCNLLSFTGDLPLLYLNLGDRAGEWLLGQGRAMVVGVSQRTIGSNKERGRLSIQMSTLGKLWSIEWMTDEGDFLGFARAASAASYAKMVDALTYSGEETQQVRGSPPHSVWEIRGSVPRQLIFADSELGVDVSAFRNVVPGFDPTRPRQNPILYMAVHKRPEFFMLLSSVAAFLFMARKGRAFVKTGLMLSLLTLGSSILVATGGTTIGDSHSLGLAIAITYNSLLILLLWLGAESLLLGISAGAATDITALASWSPTARGGSQILAGGLTGLAAAGVHLLASGLAISTPGLFPLELSVLLQSANFDQNPLFRAALWAGLILWAEAMVRLFRLPFAAAIGIGALLLSNYSPWGPWTFGLACAIPLATIFLISVRRIGVAGLLASTHTYCLAPLLFFAARYWPWLRVTFFLIAALFLALLVLGVYLLLRRHQGDDATRIFISYSHKDAGALAALKRHLHGITGIALWSDQEIPDGYDPHREIDRNLKSADVLIALVSPSLLASNYCQSREIRFALRRNRRGQTRVIPIRIEPSAWSREATPLTELQAVQVGEENGIRPWQEWESADWGEVRRALAADLEQVRESRRALQRPVWQIE